MNRAGEHPEETAQTVNRVEEPASVPSMSARASTTRAQMAEIAETNLTLMTTQLDAWGAKVDALVANVETPEADTRTGYPQAIDALKTKYELSRVRFEEFKKAGSAGWGLFRSGIEPAWIDFQDALDKLTSSLVHENNPQGETHEDPSAA
jgi:hypothetical protein